MSVTQPATVLVADDSATVRALVRMQLEAAGYAVLEVEDGQQAVKAVHAAPVDAVLLDVEMPVMDGLETIAVLKQDPGTRDVPVVFLSSRDSGDDVVEALRLGAQDYLRKPPQEAELLARVAVAVDVRRLRGQLQQRTDELDRMSRTDHLTDLANRRHLDEVLALTVGSTRAHAFPVTVLLLDLDHFKSINDRYGHGAGDAVLRCVAERLRDAVRAEDVLGRWGGEELLVVAPQTDLLGGRYLAERLRSTIAGTPVPTPAGPVEVTVSIGGATVLASGHERDEVLRTADQQLYEAKTAGRNSAQVTAMLPRR